MRWQLIANIFVLFAFNFQYNSFCLNLHTHNGTRHSFIELKAKKSTGFFDAYDRAGESLFDASIFGYCSTFKPPYKKSIGADWVNTEGWSYSNGNEIKFGGGGEPWDKPFWLWFWKRRRLWTKKALMKKDHFCRNTEMTGEVKLNGASEAGLIFRARGTWDFWALLLGNGEVKLVRVYEGRRKDLKTCTGPTGEWTILRISDQIADISMGCGVGSVFKEMDREMGDVDEIADSHMGAAGLITLNGGATFRNVFLGPVDWTPDKGNKKEISTPTKDKLLQKTSAFDLSGILKDLLRWCPNPSICGTDPYKVESRPYKSETI